MKYLNLSKNFRLYRGDEIKFESSKFPGGEPYFRLISPKDVLTDIMITIRLNSFDDIGLLLIAKDAIDRIQKNNVFGNSFKRHLYIPYFPGARQDRVMVEGESLTSKVYTDIINNMNFDSVTILDPHSDVTPGFLRNIIINSNIDYIDESIDDWRFNLARSETFSIVLPDAGAAKKISTFKKLANQPRKIYIGEKHRDISTGKLSGFGVNCDNFEGEDLFIIDDICDGGGTFKGLAGELKKRNAGNIYLFVTHGIFSKGFDILRTYFNQIFTTNSIGDLDKHNNFYRNNDILDTYNLLTQFKLK